MRLTHGRRAVATLLGAQAAGLAVALSLGLTVGLPAHAGRRAEAAGPPLHGTAVEVAQPAPAPTSPAVSTPPTTPPATAPATPPPSPLAPLTARITPDVLVVAAAPLDPAQVRGLLAATGATAALLVDAGHVHLSGGTTTALGVNPSSFRAWTPAGTAESTPLWQSVARGQVAVAQSVAKALAVPLGGLTTVGTAQPTVEQVGAYATTGLPGVGLVVDHTDDASLGLVPAAGLVLTAAGRDPVVTAALAQKYLAGVRAAGTATPVRVPASHGRLEWVAPTYGPITSPYGPRPDPNHPGRTEFHEGIDIGAPLGTPIYAAAAGVVQYAGPATGFGQEVVLTHADGVSTVYGHMETILVTSGPVAAGQPIALVGAEGDATGPHLHFEVHVDGQTVDPAAWLVAHGVRIDR